MTSLFYLTLSNAKLHCTNGRVQAALMTGSLVLVDQTTACHAVDNRNGSLVSFFCGALVTFINGLDDLLDVRTHH